MTGLIEIGLLILGFALTVWWVSLVVLPIIYGFPRALWWCICGRARWRAPFLYLISPVVWTTIVLAVGVLLFVYFRATSDYLMSSAGFAFGQALGLLVFAVRVIFSRSAHRDIEADFQDFMQRYVRPTTASA